MHHSPPFINILKAFLWSVLARHIAARMAARVLKSLVRSVLFCHGETTKVIPLAGGTVTFEVLLALVEREVLRKTAEVFGRDRRSLVAGCVA